ncbi:MAG: ABC transporter ATP-binding protein [Planctomycetota bacterium]
MESAPPTRPTQAEAAVRCEAIEKSFAAGEQRIRVLRGTDFVAEAGKMNFLVGPSGCGKTTLISVIGAILRCEEGTLEVLGEDLRKLRSRKLADFRLNNLGFIFQQFNLLPALSAEENASMPLVAQGMSTSKAEKKARQLLERLGLEGQTRKMPNQLSGGQQQRVAIARALVHEPRLLICDEPTASLDAASGHTVMELLRDVALEGDRSVIVVTHDNRIFEFADRISHMADGQITKVETRGETEFESRTRETGVQA